MSVEPGKFDAAAAIAALKKAHYPATKAEDVSPKANPAEEASSDAKPEEASVVPEGDTTDTPVEEKPAEAEASTESAPKQETEVVE